MTTTTPSPQPGIAEAGTSQALELGLVHGSAPSPRLTGEAYFADRDAFIAYVLDEVNPARAAEQLSTVSHGAASRLYDVMHSKCYLQNVAISQPDAEPTNT